MMNWHPSYVESNIEMNGFEVETADSADNAIKS